MVPLTQAKPEQRLNLLLYTHEFPPFAGGAGVYTAALAKGLAGLGHEVTVLTLDYDNSTTEWDANQPYQIIRMRPTARFKNVVAAMNMLKIWIRLRPHMMFITDAGAQLGLSLLLPLFSAKMPSYTVTIHGSEIAWYLTAEGKRWPETLRVRLSRYLLARAKAVVCGSSFTKEALLKVLPGLADRVMVVQYGIDVGQFASFERPQVGNIGHEVSVSGPTILTVARLIPEKGIDTVLRALPAIINDVPRVKYFIVGTGPDRTRLDALIDELSLNDYVVFTGNLSDSERNLLYSLCDIFILISRPGQRVEGFGLVYAEAGAMAKPTIGGRTGGVPEIVNDNFNGILVDPFSLKEVEQALRTLLLNPDLAKKMGANGRKLVEGNFTIQRMAEEMLKVACH